MTLQELLDEYDTYLDEMAVTMQFDQQLYRGDNRDLAAITAAGGFFPKEHGSDAPTIEVLLKHCAINGYGGPFISTTEDMDIARGFGSNLYSIDEGMFVVAEENWTKLADYHKRFKAAMDEGQGTFIERNNVSQKMELLWPALQYHEAQKERLVINNIPIGNIMLI